MSTTIQEQNGITITRFAAGNQFQDHEGVAFQVTWIGPEHKHIWIHFATQEEAEAFAELLERRLVR